VEPRKAEEEEYNIDVWNIEQFSML